MFLRSTLLIIGLFAFVGCGSESPSEIQAPPLAASVLYNDDEHEAFTLEQYRGQAVLVDFWATWCGPCVRSIPELVHWHEAYGNRGLVIVGLTDQSSKDLDAFMEKHNITYRIAVTEDLGANDYGIKGIPHLVLIGKDGSIIKRGHPNSFSDADIEGAL